MSVNIISIQLEEDENIAFCGDLHSDSQGPESRIDDFMVTVITKIEDILKTCIESNVRALFFSGDIFSRVTVPHDCVNEMLSVMLKFKDAGIRVFTIVGNHDIARNQLEKLKKSPLQSLFSARAMEHINLSNRVVINKKTLITPVGYTEYPVKALEKAPYNILLAHMFYNGSKMILGEEGGVTDNRYNITPDNVGEWKYDCIVLGHDHVEYPIMECDGTDIIRPGSVLRATTHEYNFNRIPCFYILKKPWKYDVKNFEKKLIKALPFEEVASNSVVTDKNLKSITGLAGLLENLAEKLVDNDKDLSDDIILNIIRTDENLESDVRHLILQYLSECGILI